MQKDTNNLTELKTKAELIIQEMDRMVVYEKKWGWNTCEDNIHQKMKEIEEKIKQINDDKEKVKLQKKLEKFEDDTNRASYIYDREKWGTRQLGNMLRETLDKIWKQDRKLYEDLRWKKLERYPNGWLPSWTFAHPDERSYYYDFWKYISELEKKEIKPLIKIELTQEEKSRVAFREMMYKACEALTPQQLSKWFYELREQDNKKTEENRKRVKRTILSPNKMIIQLPKDLDEGEDVVKKSLQYINDWLEEGKDIWNNPDKPCLREDYLVAVWPEWHVEDHKRAKEYKLERDNERK